MKSGLKQRLERKNRYEQKEGVQFVFKKYIVVINDNGIYRAVFQSTSEDDATNFYVNYKNQTPIGANSRSTSAKMMKKDKYNGF